MTQQVVKANEAGRLVLLDDYGTVYLKDSFISEDRFRNICERVLWSSKIITTEETGSFDHYSPGIYFHRSPKINRFMSSSFLYQGKFYWRQSKSKDRKFVKNEFVGFRKPIWESYMWKFIEHEYTHQKRPLIFTAKRCVYFYSKSDPSKKIYDDCIASWEFMPINFQYYEKILPVKKRSHYDEQSYFKHTEFQMPLPFGMPIEASERMVYKIGDYELMGKLLAQSSLPENDDGGRLPIMCIDPDSHAERVGKNDWAVYTLLNKNNGNFYQYFFFEKELQYAYPLFIRNWSLDYLGGVHISKKSTVGVTLEKKKKMIVSNIKKEFNPAKLILALNEKNRPWRPNPIPENKLNIPQDRCFYEDIPARIFGSTCKVWELDIW